VKKNFQRRQRKTTQKSMETKQGRKGHLAIQEVLTFGQFFQITPKIATKAGNHVEYKNMNCLEGAVAHGSASSIFAFAPFEIKAVTQ